jgi:hypothetical protein
MVTIPYELRSKSLVNYVSDLLWLGPVNKGDTISRTILLHTNPHRNVTLKAVSMSPDFQVRIPESGKKSNHILVECVFSSQESGLKGGTAKLLARDNKGNEQTIGLDYCAFVQP